MRSPPGKRQADRVVRHTLADGTAKEYRYARNKRSSRTAAAAGDTIAALIEAYQRSPEWRDLAPSTQHNYRIYLRSLERVGHVRATDVRRRELLLARDAIAEKRGNGAATGFIRAASALFGWAVGREWIDYSPATRIKALPGGHLQAWSQQEAEHALAHLPEPLRRVVVLALHTGARRVDLVTMPWSAYDGAALRFVPQKTRRQSPAPLVIPCHPNLKRELDAWHRDKKSVTILADARGASWKPTILSQYLPAALVRIGLSNELNVHGLRKLAATRLAEAGCSMHEIAAITGHRTLGMVQLYTRSADQERLAGAAIVRLSEHSDKLTKLATKTGG